MFLLPSCLCSRREGGRSRAEKNAQGDLPWHYIKLPFKPGGKPLPVAARSQRRPSFKFGGFDHGLGTKTDCDRKRNVMSSRGDVIVVDSERKVVDFAFNQSLVVGVGEFQGTRPHNGPHTVSPDAVDVAVIGARPLRAFLVEYVLGNEITFLPSGVGIERNRVLVTDQRSRRLTDVLSPELLFADLLLIIHNPWLVAFWVHVRSERITASIAQTIFEHIAIIRHADGI